MKVMSALLLALTLTSCSFEQEDTSLTIAERESLYVAALKMDGGSLAESGTDDELLDLGYAACQAFDGGDTPYTFGRNIMDEYGETTQIRTFLAAQLAASVVFLCPEHKGLMER